MSDFFENLYRNHRQGMYSLALSIVRSHQVAEDVIHNVFVKLVSDQGKRMENPPSDWVAYIFRAVRNGAIDETRSDQRQQKVSEILFENFCPLSNEVDPLLADERNGFLREAIDHLPERDREAVLLRFFAGLTFAQAAEVTGTSSKTIASRYRRALGKLESELKGKV